MEHPDFTPAASCVPCHVVYTNVRSGEEQSARRINYKSDTVDGLPCSILQRAAPKQKIMRWGGIRPSRACGLGYSLERLVATDLQSSTEHKEVGFHSGSTCWKTINTFSPLGSASKFIPLKSACTGAPQEKNTVTFPSSKMISCLIDLTQRRVVLFSYTHDTRLPLPCAAPPCVFFFVLVPFLPSLTNFPLDQTTFVKNS